MLVSDIVVKELPDWARQNADLYNSCVAGAISEEDYLQGLRDVGMVELEVRDRLVYDAGQLGVLAGPEISAVKTSCCGSAPNNDLINSVLEQVAGNVWSAQIYGQKRSAEKPSCC